MSSEISKIDLEDVSTKLKGVEFLLNCISYSSNYDEESFSCGVMLVSDNIRNIISDVKKIEDAI